MERPHSSKQFVERILLYRLHKFAGRFSQSSAAYDKLRLMCGHSFANRVIVLLMSPHSGLWVIICVIVVLLMSP